ncbi:hypothetical protein C0J52_07251 [Blattella germanica]|nr:hypothetical protein C0J52_07251 [Blattella germanica]
MLVCLQILTSYTICCVPTCGSKAYESKEGLSRKLSFHRFLLDERRQREWIERVNPSFSSSKTPKN